MRTYQTKSGETHHVSDDGTCRDCDKQHKVPCRKKWRHTHIGEGYEVKVFSKPGRRIDSPRHRFMIIPDDGSVCDRYVTPEPKRLMGLPDSPVISRSKDPIGNAL